MKLKFLEFLRYGWLVRARASYDAMTIDNGIPSRFLLEIQENSIDSHLF